MSVVHLDYETRSRVDLPSCGAWRYGCDDSTEVLMAGVSADGSDEVFLWVNPKYQTADCLGENDQAAVLLRSADWIYAHNALFEIAITEGRRFHETLGMHPIQIQQWRCTMAMARKAALPESLGALAGALGLTEQKDAKGKALIKFFSVPRPDGAFNEPKDHPDKWIAFCEYCRQDVRTEKAVHVKLKPFELQGSPLETFQFDLRMNQRGVPVNTIALCHAQNIIDEVQTTVTKRFQELTGLNPTQREAVRQLVNLPDMQAKTIEEAIKAPINNPLYANREEILRLYQKVSYAAVKKVATMLDWACPDGRMRGVFKYYGAGTGRWSAGGPQVHNAKKATAEMRPITPEVYAYIGRGRATVEGISTVYGDPLEVISCCIRHFIHEPGRMMLDGDYNAIEARILCWLAGQTDALAEYRAGVDRYVLMAATAYGVEPAAVTADQREVGKRAILGLGFGMGTEKFISSSLEQYGLVIEPELAERAKVAFRRKHDKITAYWYMLDNQAREALAKPGSTCGPFKLVSCSGIPYLLARLPSGRSLAYPYPKVEKDGDYENVTYWGQLFQSTQWGRIKIYGGKWAENLTQACAADIMANGSLEAERQGMPPFALIHDQALALQDRGQSPEEFAAALGTLPAWANGLPVKVEAKLAKFYSK